MVLPERDHATQKVRPAEKRTIRNRRSTDHDMATAAGRDVATVVVKLFSGQPVPARLLEHQHVDLLKFVKFSGRRQVYFQNSRVGCNGERLHSRIGRWSVALQPHWF